MMKNVETIKKESDYDNLFRRFGAKMYSASSRSAAEGFFEIDQNGIIDELGRRRRVGKGRVLLTMPKRDLLKMLFIMTRWMPRIAEGRKKSLSDLSIYFQELEREGCLSSNCGLSESYPNREIWEDISSYSYSKWGCTIGFTHVPRELIYKGKGLLFEHAVVVLMEMEKNKINTAPGAEAGEEAYRVYAILGEAVNDIAGRLREFYHIKCQSHHPLGGLVNDSALASKAGLGWQGSNGLLVTPEYGQRQRIASVFIQEKYFPYTDSDEHRWIETFCESCRACIRNCPAGAVNLHKKVVIENVEGIGAVRTCIDRYKCYNYFEKTLGCSVCLKVCPFSQGQNAYAKIRERFQKIVSYG